MCDSGHSESKRAYFVEVDDLHMYAGRTEEEVLGVIKAELESIGELSSGEDLTISITHQMMTDEEIEALPDM